MRGGGLLLRLCSCTDAQRSAHEGVCSCGEWDFECVILRLTYPILQLTYRVYVRAYYSAPHVIGRVGWQEGTWMKER